MFKSQSNYLLNEEKRIVKILRSFNKCFTVFLLRCLCFVYKRVHSRASSFSVVFKHCQVAWSDVPSVEKKWFQNQ